MMFWERKGSKGNSADIVSAFFLFFFGTLVGLFLFILGYVFYSFLIIQEVIPHTWFDRNNAEDKAELYATESGKPLQYVILSFDGSKSAEMWKETLDFAQEVRATKIPVAFTYFISGVYLLDKETAFHYKSPREGSTSRIGFGNGPKDIEQRVGFINRAISEGHEIGSHAMGHFDGSVWTYDEWMQEHGQFHNSVFRLGEYNPGVSKEATIRLKENAIVGFRAPELGINGDMYKSLKAAGFRYDAGSKGAQNTWPRKDGNGIWRYPIPSIQIGDDRHWVISMDYSLYHDQSAVQDVAVRGTPLWQKFYDDLYTAYMRYYLNSYNGNRSPVYVANHFAKWNDGVYWEAMKQFARTVCGQPEVRCATFSELTDYLDYREALEHPENTP